MPADFKRVESFQSKSWGKIGLRLRHHNGSAIDLASVINRGSTLDMFYDGLNLMCDASWAEHLAVAIGKTINRPAFNVDESFFDVEPIGIYPSRTDL